MDQYQRQNKSELRSKNMWQLGWINFSNFKSTFKVKVEPLSVKLVNNDLAPNPKWVVKADYYYYYYYY